jgi:hypothetical protein
MKTIAQLCELGQGLWLDNITSELQDCGKLESNCTEFSLTGLMSIPRYLRPSHSEYRSYYNAIYRKVKEDESGETLFF